MRIIVAFALAAILASTGLSYAQYAPNRTTTVPPSTTAPSNAPAIHADQFSSEADAKAHCLSGTTVVWMNSKSGIYHFAGSRDYDHGLPVHREYRRSNLPRPINERRRDGVYIQKQWWRRDF